MTAKRKRAANNNSTVWARSPMTLAAAIVTTIGMLITLIIVFSISGDQINAGQKMIILTSVFGLITNAIPSLMALQKSEATNHGLNNGEFRLNMKTAMIEMKDDTDSEGVYKDTHTGEMKDRR
jgi:ACR3 family arsenite efflux pump ArsB